MWGNLPGATEIKWLVELGLDERELVSAGHIASDQYMLAVLLTQNYLKKTGLLGSKWRGASPEHLPGTWDTGMKKDRQGPCPPGLMLERGRRT